MTPTTEQILAAANWKRCSVASNGNLVYMCGFDDEFVASITQTQYDSLQVEDRTGEREN